MARGDAEGAERVGSLIEEIVDAASHLHRGLGPGLLESVYQRVLAKRLREQGLQVDASRTVAFEFDGLTFDTGLTVDLLVEGTVVVELTSVEALAPIHWKRTLTYLRLLDLPVGLLLNFGAPTMKAGTCRVVNRCRPTAASPWLVNQLARAAPAGRPRTWPES